MRAELRRSIVLACAGLLAGFALVVTLYGAGTYFKRGLGSPVSFDAPGRDDPPGRDGAPPPAVLTPNPLPPDRPGPPADQGARPGEGASTPVGKPLAALGPGGPLRDQGPDPSRAGDAPSFDIIRIEPDGEAVIAGRAPPNTTVELLRDGRPMARALVDPSGQFAIVPPPFPGGPSEITLRVTGADGQVRASRDSVAVVVAPNRTTKPLIALTSPDKPTIVLSQPDPVTASAAPGGPGSDRLATTMPGGPKTGGPKTDGPKIGATTTGAPSAQARPGQGDAANAASRAGAGATEAPAPVKIVSVEAEEGGRLYVTSQAQPGATVRLYLNDTLVAPGSAGPDGRVAFTIGRGVRPGDYRIRVDQVDPVSGAVRTRSEVAFTVPGGTRPGGAKIAEAAGAGSGLPEAPGPRPNIALPKESVPRKESAPPKESVLPKDTSPPKGSPARAADTAPPTDQTPPAEGTRTVFVPEIGTARIVRGDSLWQISRRIYGKGTRYTVIFDANQPQIRNPDLIYPGQVFVLPSDGTAAVPEAGTRG